MSSSLRSENLTISIPYKGCDKNCKYCISKMTGYTENSDIAAMMLNSRKVKTVADSAGITNVLLTGKGEPTKNMEDLEKLALRFKEYPLELQTNGLSLLTNPRMLTKLDLIGINVIAISLDHQNQLKQFEPIIKQIIAEGIVVRLTFNISDMLGDLDFGDLFHYCRNNEVHQLLLRKLSIPKFDVKDKGPVQWITEHASNGNYEKMVKWMEGSITEIGRHIRTLNTGEKVYDLRGVSVVSIDYCIQEESNGTNLRSLIFNEDGHLYTSWNSKASILF